MRWGRTFVVYWHLSRVTFVLTTMWFSDRSCGVNYLFFKAEVLSVVWSCNKYMLQEDVLIYQGQEWQDTNLVSKFFESGKWVHSTYLYVSLIDCHVHFKKNWRISWTTCWQKVWYEAESHLGERLSCSQPRRMVVGGSVWIILLLTW
jgi:hypothetical protein